MAIYRKEWKQSLDDQERVVYILEAKKLNAMVISHLFIHRFIWLFILILFYVLSAMSSFVSLNIKLALVNPVLLWRSCALAYCRM